MAKLVEMGASIECNRSNIAVRKINKPDQLIEIKQLNGETLLLFKYKTNKRALVRIIEELKPLKCLICETSALNRDDILEGEVIEIYTPRKFKLDVLSNYSNVHGIQSGDLKMFTYAKIAIPWQFILDKNRIANN